MSQIGNQSTSACGGVGYVPVPPRLWSRAGGNNCPNCASNNGYAACIGDNGLSYSTYCIIGVNGSTVSASFSTPVLSLSVLANVQVMSE